MSQETEERKQIGGLPSNDVERRQHRHRGWLSLAIALIAVAALLVSGIWSRVRARTTLKAETAQVALTAVSVVSPKQAAPAQEIILPGNVQPFITAPIYARTNGYLKRWYVDIGARVKQGQLLAVIETPEVDQQLQQARSNLATAKANLELASVTRTRYLGLLKSNAVSQQDADNAVGAYNANKAIVEADQAAVDQYTALVSFEKIYAPFDGIITARNTDIGDLINSGGRNRCGQSYRHAAHRFVCRGPLGCPGAELHLAASRQYPAIPLRGLTCGGCEGWKSYAHCRDSWTRFRQSDRDRRRPKDG